MVKSLPTLAPVLSLFLPIQYYLGITCIYIKNGVTFRLAMPIRVFLRNHRSCQCNVDATNKPFSSWLWPYYFLTCLLLVYGSKDSIHLLLLFFLVTIHHHIFYSMSEFRMGLLLFLFCCLFQVLALKICGIYRYSILYLSLLGSLTLSHIPHCVFISIYVCLFVIALFA